MIGKERVTAAETHKGEDTASGKHALREMQGSKCRSLPGYTGVRRGAGRRSDEVGRNLLPQRRTGQLSTLGGDGEDPFGAKRTKSVLRDGHAHKGNSTGVK